MRTTRSSTLRLLVDETVGELVLKRQISAFLISHPSLSIEFFLRAWSSGETGAGIDLVLQYAPALSAPAGAAKLGEQRLLTCAAPQYLRERGLPHHPLDLRRHRHEGVIVSDNSTTPSAWKFENSPKRLSVETRKRVVTPSLSTALAFALGGAGVSQIPECWGIGHVRSGTLIRLLPDWETRLHLFAFEPRGAHSPYTPALIRFARTLIEMGAPTRPC